MARPKKVQEAELKEITLEDLPVMPEIPVQEPTTEEQIEMATKELQQKVQDLTMQLYNKEHENSILKEQMKKQEIYYNNAIARLVLNVYGD